MSVTDMNKIDAIGKSKTNDELDLLITDHLDWENEYEHLVILQDKINIYLGYIESKQFFVTHPNESVDGYVIEIVFKNGITERCFKFLETIGNQLKQYKIRIRIEVYDPDD